MKRNLRKWCSLIVAVVLYYTVHEGAHLLVALILGTFERVRFAAWGLGMQIVVDSSAMSDVQLFVFGAVGAAATLVAGYLMVLGRRRILQSSSKLLRAIAYYTTLIFLLLDPLYLCILHNFVGGGDMNSIALIGIPKTAASIFFGALFVINLLVFVKSVYPSYKQRFAAD